MLIKQAGAELGQAQYKLDLVELPKELLNQSNLLTKKPSQLAAVSRNPPSSSEPIKAEPLK